MAEQLSFFGPPYCYPSPGFRQCRRCGAKCKGQRRVYCSNWCQYMYKATHSFGWRKFVYWRDGRCVHCGSTENLEINHVVPLNGAPRDPCTQHADLVELACKPCHEDITKRQREAGMFNKAWHTRTV